MAIVIIHMIFAKKMPCSFESEYRAPPCNFPIRRMYKLQLKNASIAKIQNSICALPELSANECTEVSKPDLTKNVPSRVSKKVVIPKNMVHLINLECKTEKIRE